MKVLHIDPSGGYEEAVLISNKVSPNNSLAVVEIKGKRYFSGGYILKDSPEIREILDVLTPEKQLSLVKMFRDRPYVKRYLEDWTPLGTTKPTPNRDVIIKIGGAIIKTTTSLKNGKLHLDNSEGQIDIGYKVLSYTFEALKDLAKQSHVFWRYKEDKK